MSATKPTVERLRELFSFDSERGWLVRRITTSNRCPAGSRAGTFDASVGYRRVRVDGRIYMEHAVVLALSTGAWPVGLVDHRNTVRTDNSPENLREGSRSLNQQNLRRARRDSKTGVLGVIQVKDRFLAHIRIDGKQKHLGSFGTAEEASAAYLAAKRLHHEGCTL